MADLFTLTWKGMTRFASTASLPSKGANVNGLSRERQLAALVELCRELVRLRINVGLSDARPAVSVRDGLVHPKIWVEVDASDGSFVWRRDDHERHAVDDPAGAAERLAAYLKSRDAGQGNRS